MPLAPQSPLWYDRLTTLQKGYYYPWRSMLPVWHGEDVFRNLVALHLQANLDVLEVACAQGELALEMAATARSVVAYDRMADYIRLAQEAAQERGIHNVSFLLHDSSTQANGGQALIPAPDGSFDLLVCSKGPFHWIEDSRRVARPGATLLMLVPDTAPLTPWHGLLPEALRWQAFDDPNWAYPAIEERLGAVQLNLHSWWSFDVPEIFATPEDFYIWRAWGTTPDEVPTYIDAASDLERIFEKYAGSQGLEIRRRRYIWKAIVANG
ncbi:MAG: class I SAM-dependent methyltransferase [Chloroflexota bacterium]